jgi:hypothetical protein
VEIKEIEIISAILLLPLFLFGLLFSLNFAFATTLGGLLTITNLFFLNRGMRGMLADKQKKIKFFLQYTLRFVLLISVVYLLLYRGRIDTAGFIVGLSVVFLGILIHSIKNNFLSPKPGQDEP